MALTRKQKVEHVAQLIGSDVVNGLSFDAGVEQARKINDGRYGFEIETPVPPDSILRHSDVRLTDDEMAEAEELARLQQPEAITLVHEEYRRNSRDEVQVTTTIERRGNVLHFDRDGGKWTQTYDTPGEASNAFDEYVSRMARTVGAMAKRT